MSTLALPQSESGRVTLPLHTEDVVFKNGLIDPTSLLPYMTEDRCEQLLDPRPIGSCVAEYHHLYFSRKAFKKRHVPLVAKHLRSSPYNQLLILNCQEDMYHQSTVNEVPQDEIDIEAGQVFLEEAQWLTDYAVASCGLADYLRRLDEVSPFWIKTKFKFAGRVALQEEVLDEASTKIARIEVMEPSIVTGALKAYLKQQPESHLEQVVQARIVGNSLVMTPKVYNAARMRNASRTELETKIKHSGWVLRKALSLPEAA